MNLPTMWKSLGGAALVGLTALSSGCASQQTLKNYQDEVRSLRDERTQLKKENRDLRMQVDAYEISLAEANARLEDVPPSREYSELDELGIDYGTKGGNFVISVPSSITFASGRAELTAKGKEALQAVARTLKNDYGEGIFWVEGHTDTDPIRKSKWGSNRELSVGRAMAVLHYLVEDCGVADSQCVVAGHGEYEPVAANDDRAGKARNRRVEIVVHR